MRLPLDRRLSVRLYLQVLLMTVGLLVLCVTMLGQLRGSLLEDRKEKTRNLVETAVGVLAYHQQLARDGKLTDQQARQDALRALRGLRYGNKDYFFVYDDHVNCVLVPPKPEREGKPAGDWQDSKGKYYAREFVRVGEAGGGFVDYLFPRAGETTPLPKLSYVMAFAPWGWVVGTGIYIDDVDTLFWHDAWLFGGFSVLLLCVLGGVGWLIALSVLRQLGGEPALAMEVMRRVASGDLSPGDRAARGDSLLGRLDAMVSALRILVQNIHASADEVIGDAARVTSASHALARSAGLQADATREMAAGIEQLANSTASIAERAQATETGSRGAVDVATAGVSRVDEATSAMQRIASTVTEASSRISTLHERVNEISSVTGVIKEIAGQTNLLALNAAIEAARAGEQGRGFAVVADAVRTLAERTSVATTEIESTVVRILSETANAVHSVDAALPEVRQGVEMAGAASNSLRSIADVARLTLDHVGEVAGAVREQGHASALIGGRVEEIARAAQHTTEMSLETTAVAQRLEGVARMLKERVGTFRV